MEILNVPQGEFQLSRYPLRKKEQLRAWDAADEYLLSYFYEHYSHEAENKKILIVNDSFGALAIALSGTTTTVWIDSVLSQYGILKNFSDNGLPVDNLNIKNSIETPKGEYDVIFIKIPKSLAFLEDQLIRIKPFLLPTTTIIAAGMAKSIHTSTLKLFEKHIGTTKTSLAKKKARLIFTQLNENIKSIVSPYPKSYVLENTDFTLINHANVFSRDSLDIGTRFFLQHIPQSESYEKIIDLGCGNGVVGLIAAEKNPQARILCLDASYMAVESARLTFDDALNKSLIKTVGVTFKVNDCLSGIKDNSADLILNNPPFHQDNAVGDEVAWQMFNQSKSVLKRNGALFVVGNRHLGYHIKLKKIFGNCKVIATNKKFVILKSVSL